MALHHMLRAAAGNSAGPSDPYFEYNTLLLTGDGTNGAQNNTFLDSSTNNFTITRNGNTTQGTFSPYGNLWSNYFDGSGDYLSLPTNTALEMGSGDFTWEFWINPNSVASSAHILAQQSQDITVQFDAGNSNQLIVYDGSVNIIGSVSTSTWTHVALVRASGALKVYLNGVATGASWSNTSSTRFTLSNGLIASRWGGTNNLNGYISNLRIVKGTALYTANFTPSTTPLTAVSGTSLLTCQSNRFVDNSSNNFTLTVNGNTSVQRFSPFNPTAPYSASTIGGSGYFDGTGDILKWSGTTVSGNFTVETFAYFTSDDASGYSIVFTTDIGSQNIQFYVDAGSGGVGLFLNGVVCALTGSSVLLNQWNHIAWVRSGTTCTIYVNGVSIVSGTSSATFDINLLGGLLSGGYEVNGYLSSSRIVNGTAVYTSNFTPPTAPLAAISGTSLLCNFTNAGIPDAAMMNDLETVGNAQVSTSVKKYGTGSIYMDGTGDWLYAPPNTLAQMGTGNFTIEGWFYAAASPSYWTTLISLCLSTTQGHEIRVGYGGIANSGLFGFLYPNSSNNSDLFAAVSSNPSLNTWYHFALVRNGTAMTLYLNGTSAATASSVGFNHNGTIVYVGANPYADPQWNGYIDDLRITKGYARYTANFTPPTAALPTY